MAVAGAQLYCSNFPCNQRMPHLQGWLRALAGPSVEWVADPLCHRGPIENCFESKVKKFSKSYSNGRIMELPLRLWSCPLGNLDRVRKALGKFLNPPGQ